MSRLELFLAALQLWLSDRTPIHMDLCSRPGQRLGVQVGPDKRLISSNDRPGMFITYSGVGLDFLAYTVTDQSCISLAISELARSLVELRDVSASEDSRVVDL